MTKKTKKKNKKKTNFDWLCDRVSCIISRFNLTFPIICTLKRAYGNLEGSAWGTSRELPESTWRAFSPVPYPASQMYTLRTPSESKIYATGTWKGGLLVAPPGLAGRRRLRLILCFVAVRHCTGRWPLVGPREPRTRPPDGDFWLESGASHPGIPFTWNVCRPNWCGFGVLAWHLWHRRLSLGWCEFGARRFAFHPLY